MRKVMPPGRGAPEQRVGMASTLAEVYWARKRYSAGLNPVPFESLSVWRAWRTHFILFFRAPMIE